MLSDKNYEFEVSISKESFRDKTISNAMIGQSNQTNRKIRKKYGFNPNKGVSFKRTKLNVKTLLDMILEGRVFCNLFNVPENNYRKDGTFGSTQKTIGNFEGSYLICVDIDHTRYTSVEDFIKDLTLKPSFYHTSYRNMKYENGECLGARFRLVYVFDSIISNPYYFRYCVSSLNSMIEKNTGEEIKDKCNRNCTQYFNGTCRENPEIVLGYGHTDYIYNLNDIGVSREGFIQYLIDYCGYGYSPQKTVEMKSLLFSLTGKDYEYDSNSKRFELANMEDSTNSFPIINENQPQSEILSSSTSSYSQSIKYILNDWDRLEEEDFKKCREWELTRQQTKYIYRVEKDWINNLYQYVDDDYFRLFYYVNTQKNGQKRRNNLYERMCLRRVIYPNITKDEMVVNTIIDIMRFFDRKGDKGDELGSDFIMRNVDSCFNLTIQDIEYKYHDSIDSLKRITRPKRGIIYINRKAHSKETTYYILDDLYNPEVSTTENLEYLNNALQYRISKTTLYNYVRDRNIKTDMRKLIDSEVMNLLDVHLSVQKNHQFLKDNDFRIGRNRVASLLKKKKEENKTIESRVSVSMNNEDFNTINVSRSSLWKTG